MSGYLGGTCTGLMTGWKSDGSCGLCGRSPFRTAVPPRQERSSDFELPSDALHVIWVSPCRCNQGAGAEVLCMTDCTLSPALACLKWLAFGAVE